MWASLPSPPLSGSRCWAETGGTGGQQGGYGDGNEASMGVGGISQLRVSFSGMGYSPNRMEETLIGTGLFREPQYLDCLLPASMEPGLCVPPGNRRGKD